MACGVDKRNPSTAVGWIEGTDVSNYAGQWKHLHGSLEFDCCPGIYRRSERKDITFMSQRNQLDSARDWVTFARQILTGEWRHQFDRKERKKCHKSAGDVHLNLWVARVSFFSLTVAWWKAFREDSCPVNESSYCFSVTKQPSDGTIQFLVDFWCHCCPGCWEMKQLMSNQSRWNVANNSQNFDGVE